MADQYKVGADTGRYFIVWRIATGTFPQLVKRFTNQRVADLYAAGCEMHGEAYADRHVTRYRERARREHLHDDPVVKELAESAIPRLSAMLQIGHEPWVTEAQVSAAEQIKRGGR